MKLSISNIAWASSEDVAVYDLIRTLGVSHIEIAPSRIWPKPVEVSEEDARRWIVELHAAGLHVSSYQALLFGQPDLLLFGSNESRQACENYLKKIINLAGWLEAGPLVFGSPKNRLRGSLSQTQAFEIAAAFFHELGDYATQKGCCLVIEPNPTAYGCDFAQNVAEAAELVRETASSGFGLHIDAGELAMNNEDIAQVIDADFALIRHVHVSEPMLARVGIGHNEVHQALSHELRTHGYDGFVSIEMKRHEPVLDTVSSAVRFTQQSYLSP